MTFLDWITGWLPVVKFRRTWRAASANLEAMSRLAEQALLVLEMRGEDGLHEARGLLYTIGMLRDEF